MYKIPLKVTRIKPKAMARRMNPKAANDDDKAEGNEGIDY